MLILHIFNSVSKQCLRKIFHSGQEWKYKEMITLVVVLNLLYFNFQADMFDLFTHIFHNGKLSGFLEN